MSVPYAYDELKRRYEHGLFETDTKGNRFTYVDKVRYYAISYEGKVLFSIFRP